VSARYPEGSTVLARVFETTRLSRGRRSRARWNAPALPALVLGTALLVALASVDPAVLCVLPALALPLLLALRRYPGERVLARRAPHPPTRRGGASAAAPRTRFVICRPRGRLLLAFSLAVRPPPAALLAAG
jgi:hypothetical protein